MKKTKNRWNIFRMSVEYYLVSSSMEDYVWVGTVNMSGVFPLPDSDVKSVRDFLREYLKGGHTDLRVMDETEIDEWREINKVPYKA